MLLVLLPLLVHLPLWLSGRSTDPIWVASNVTQSEPGISGLPWIDINVGVTSEALGRLEAHDWLHGVVPWWNPYTGVGVPLAGELQPGAFFLPFIFLFLLPDGLLWEKICIQMLTGVATYAFLRELGLSRLSSLMGGGLYALSGTIAWAPGPAGVYCSMPFLPLLLWGMERARRLGDGAASILATGVATGFALLPGFPEPAYISGLLACAWGVYRLAGESARWRMARRTLAGFTCGLLVALPVLIAFADYSRLSNSFGVHKLGDKALPWAAFSATLLPYVYGPLESGYHSAPLLSIWDYIGGYCGLLVVLLAIAGWRSHKLPRGLKILLAAWIVVAWAKTYGVQPVMGLMNFVPLLHQTQFYRYSQPSWSLALIVLAALALDEFETGTPRRRYAFGLTLALLGIGVAAGWPLRAFWERPHEMAETMFVMMSVSAAWALMGLAATGVAWSLLRGEKRRIVIATVIVLDAAVMFMVPQVSSVRGKSIDVAAVRFLREHQGLSRTFSFQPLSPNYGAYYGVATIDHNILPVPRLWEQYITEKLLPGYEKKDLGTTFFPSVNGDGAGEQALNENIRNYLKVGTKFVATMPGRDLRPKTYVPGSDIASQPAISLRRSLLSRMKFLSSLLHWAHANEVDGSLKGRVAKWVVRRGGRLEAEAGASKTGNNGDAENLPLNAGEEAFVDVPAMPAGPPGLPISSVGVMVAPTPGATGILKIEACVGGVCSSGRRELEGKTEGTTLQVALDKPLGVDAGRAMQLRITREAGTGRFVMWMGAPAYTGQVVRGPNGVLQGHELHLVFEYGQQLPGVQRVYSDEVMDIWELPDPAAYFEVTQGGPCTLQEMQREQVTVNCTYPAKLRRRELYMPGWRVSVDGAKAVPVEQDGIFESTGLAAGSSRLRFRFVPPHEGIGWLACFAGLGGLLWQAVVLLGGRRGL